MNVFSTDPQLVVKAISYFCIHLSRVVEVEPTERIAVVDEQMAIGDVQGVHGSGKALAQ